jgi:hypothetical protein
VIRVPVTILTVGRGMRGAAEGQAGGWGNTARPHRSLSQLTPDQAETCPPELVNLAEHRIHRKQVLGGLAHEYYVAA